MWRVLFVINVDIIRGLHRDKDSINANVGPYGTALFFSLLISARKKKIRRTKGMTKAERRRDHVEQIYIFLSSVCFFSLYVFILSGLH